MYLQIHIYCAFRHPIDGAGGIMFTGCPFVCACVRADAFSDTLAVDVNQSFICKSK